MDEKELRQRLHHAADARLSGLKSDPWLAERVLANAKGGQKVKKKISAGVMIALLLALAAATALAALSLTEYYQNVLKKEGKEGSIEEWDADSLIELIDWMKQAGIELDNETIEYLERDDLTEQQKHDRALELITEYYPARDGVLTAVDIMAKEKGPIEKWSIEDRAWLSDMLAQYQPSEVEHGRNLIPGESDITQEEAEKVFFDALKEKYGLTREDMDLSTLTFSFGIGHFTIDDTSEDLRYWAVNVKMKNHKEDAGAYIKGNGELIQIVYSGAEVTTWIEEYAADRSEYNARTSAEGFYRVLHKWQPIIKEKIDSGEIDPNERPYLNSDIIYWYEITDVVALPKEGDLKEEQARSIADQAIMDELNWTEEELSCFTPWVSYRIDDVNQPVYWFVYRWYGNNHAAELFNEGRITRKVVVKIDAKSGEVVSLDADNEICVNGRRGSSVGM